MDRRTNWVPDLEAVADELIENYLSAGERGPEPTQDAVIKGDVDAINTMTSWLARAEEQGYEWQEDDWFALVQVLAKRAAWPHHPVPHGQYWCRC